MALGAFYRAILDSILLSLVIIEFMSIYIKLLTQKKEVFFSDFLKFLLVKLFNCSDFRLFDHM